MSSSKAIHKDSLRNLYHEMKSRIRIINNLLGKPEQNKNNPLPDENSFEKISNLINSIMSSAQFEAENQYRDAIVEISNWLNFAFNKAYIIENNEYNPHPLFVIKKGVEILHSFLHRDLRRKQFSAEEYEIFENFMTMIANLPDPRNDKLNQNDVDSLIDDLLK